MILMPNLQKKKIESKKTIYSKNGFINDVILWSKNFFQNFFRNILTKGNKFGNIIFVNYGSVVGEDNENMRRRSKDVKR